MPASQASTIAINVLTAPGAAFSALRERPTLLVPLLLLMAGAAATTFIYMNGVDVAWLVEEQAGQNPDADAEQIAQFAELVARIPQTGLAVLFACVATLSVGIALLLQALYFKIVTWITRDQVSYKHWFSMVTWCSLPSLLASLASIVNLLTSDRSLMPREAINPLSFANLTGLDAADGGTLQQILLNMHPMTLWSLVLMILCYRCFTGRGLAASAGIVVLPTVAIAALAFIF
jgi:hypothetical protein